MNDSINLTQSQENFKRDPHLNMQSVLSLSKLGNELLQGESKLKDSLGKYLIPPNESSIKS